ncbi:MULTISPECIES: sulfite exporter TauE/SafE family protein [unclassified Sphingomonas]|uniref:sulfite exporter TauE/SafE family protein n=1 Tax=unclassified Sphingomonas TaxID=196159 RepID=UPI0006FF67A6|nr:MULTISPECIES: sulfite exporter TauE/SafE family protein [unclassified Sphingomonas]KQX17987.1 hypothetical protein ASD17_20050 [Sphingomonas sp. Root1294]KQY70912.1 hypothetical protein ASD39_23950 [Sphingomonas sp. Root50]KRB91592.1 hypothetical protein ASE22_06360 [Sphingomonas sp. Root720]
MIAVDWLNALAGLLVGVIVGITGVGGGSLMSPILILLFGVAPATAVGTDLWFAAVTKTAGSIVHHRQESADHRIVGWLCLGSIPAAVATLLLLFEFGGHQTKSGLIVTLLGTMLIITSFATLFRRQLVSAMIDTDDEMKARRFIRFQPVLTMAAGALLGTLVTLTSVGAGALGATLLLMLYPLRLTARKLVGTDIMHAVPLTLVGGIGYMIAGSVDLRLLGMLLIGSIPGIVIGSRLTMMLDERIVQRCLAVILFITGIKLVMV